MWQGCDGCWVRNISAPSCGESQVDSVNRTACRESPRVQLRDVEKALVYVFDLEECVEAVRHGLTVVARDSWSPDSCLHR